MKYDFRWVIRQPLFLPWLALMLLGWLMVSSASTGIAEKLTGDASYFAARHGVYLVLGTLVLLVTTQIPLNKLKTVETFLLAAAFIGLILVLIPGIGHEVNGSSRWLNLVVIKIQPSEVAKVAAVFYVSGYLIRRHEEVRESFWGFIKPLFVLIAMVLLILKEPDFGSAIVLLGAAMIQLFLGGVKAGQYFLLMLGAIASAVIVLQLESWRMARFYAYLDPWAPEHVRNSGYQLTQSLIAFGRGDWFGVGLGESLQKLFYLPEAHTDFVFAIWAEETGLLGAVIAVLLLGLLLWRIWQTVWQAQSQDEHYGAQVCVGIASLFALQIIINLGVNTGLLPTKGLTLPFFSYGGSSLVIACAMVGLVMRIQHETGSQAAEEEKSPGKEEGPSNKHSGSKPVGATDGMTV